MREMNPHKARRELIKDVVFYGVILAVVALFVAIGLSDMPGVGK